MNFFFQKKKKSEKVASLFLEGFWNPYPINNSGILCRNQRLNFLEISPEKTRTKKRHFIKGFVMKKRHLDVSEQSCRALKEISASNSPLNSPRKKMRENTSFYQRFCNEKNAF